MLSIPKRKNEIETGTMKLAPRMAKLGTETAFEVLARARELERQGKQIIHLEIGEPDFETPGNIVEAGIKALRDGYTHYGPAAGMQDVREAIINHVNQTRGLNLSWKNVVVTPGAKPILFFAILALIDHGDEVIYPNPGFPIYESVINFAGGTAVPLPLRESNDFEMDIDELASLVTDKTRMIIINSPENPTGGILTAGQLERLAELAEEREIWILADEIYSRVIYDDRHVSIASFGKMANQTIIVDGLSKAYAMTGWRLGYGVMPETLAEQVTRLMINSNSCTASFSQRAIIEALQGSQEQPTKMVEEFRRRRDILVAGLNAIPGIECKLPKGAFYVFPNVRQTGIDSRKLATDLLEQAGVAVLSGTAFGEFGDGYLRLSYANSIENIQSGLDRVADFLSRR